MRRSIPFFNPLSVPSSPNSIKSIPSEEILERRGESSIWFKMQPCPCPLEKRLPDCRECIDGYIKTFQRTYPYYGESCGRISDNRLYTRFAPVTSVQSCRIQGNDFGTQRPGELEVIGFKDDHIEISENIPYWKQVFIDYEVAIYETVNLILEATGSYRVYLPKTIKDYLVGVEAVCANILPNSAVEEIRPIGFNFNSIVFDKKVFGQIRVQVELFAPINVGYRLYTIDSGNNGSKVFFENGDVELIVAPGIKMGRGDIVTLLTSMTRTSQYIQFVPGNIDKLPYSPIAKIQEVYGKVNGKIVPYFENEHFVLLDDYQIQWLVNKPQSGFSIMYEYYPSFRVVGSGDNGSPENRKRPLLFKAKSISGWRARG